MRMNPVHAEMQAKLPELERQMARQMANALRTADRLARAKRVYGVPSVEGGAGKVAEPEPKKAKRHKRSKGAA